MSEADGTLQPAAPIWRRMSWTGVLLTGSLALNLLVVGAIAAHWMWPPPPPPDGRLGPSFSDMLPRTFFADIPMARKLELVANLRSHRREFRELRRELRTGAVDFAAALRAEPYDPAVTNAAIEAYAAKGRALVERGAGIAIEFVGKLDANERKLLADRIEKRALSRRGPPRPGGPDAGDRPDPPEDKP